MHRDTTKPRVPTPVIRHPILREVREELQERQRLETRRNERRVFHEANRMKRLPLYLFTTGLLFPLRWALAHGMLAVLDYLVYSQRLSSLVKRLEHSLVMN